MLSCIGNGSALLVVVKYPFAPLEQLFTQLTYDLASTGLSLSLIQILQVLFFADDNQSCGVMVTIKTYKQWTIK
jgi:hypothetical protein